MFYLIGLGLCDEKDITVRGLEVLYFLSSRFSELNVCRQLKDARECTLKHTLAF